MHGIYFANFRPMVANSIVSGMPLLPQDMQVLEGSLCEHWFQDDGVSRIHIFIDSDTQGKRQAAYSISCEIRREELCKPCLLSHEPQLRSPPNFHHPLCGDCDFPYTSRPAHPHQSSKAADRRDCPRGYGCGTSRDL